MSIDFNHPLVGRTVAYTATHPGARPQRGVVTSVNEDQRIIFVRYGDRQTSQGTPSDRVTFAGGPENGKTVDLPWTGGGGGI